MTLFWLGTHETHWLTSSTVPLFISRNRLVRRRTLPRAAVPWALDSGGFTELKDHGRWRITPHQYVADVRRYQNEIGNLAWAAPMDWMCEPAVITGGRMGPLHFVGTHLSVAEHQRRTVNNHLELRALAPDLPIIPVLQGWRLVDYLHCVDLYTRAGIDLTREPVVGLGSVCRRQGTTEARVIVEELATTGIRLHGFGFKTLALRAYGWMLHSADSMAWSYDARRSPALPGCIHRNCASCARWAYPWRDRIVATIATHPGAIQPALFPASIGGAS
jgi:hypothetical protein